MCDTDKLDRKHNKTREIAKVLSTANQQSNVEIQMHRLALYKALLLAHMGSTVTGQNIPGQDKPGHNIS